MLATRDEAGVGHRQRPRPTAGFNAANTYDLATIFFNFGTTGATAGAKTYYFDDVAWVSTANGGGGNPGTGATQVVRS